MACFYWDLTTVAVILEYGSVMYRAAHSKTNGTCAYFHCQKTLHHLVARALEYSASQN